MADHRPDVYEEGARVVYRASSIGQCVRALVASGLGESSVYGADRQALLDRSAEEGNLHEEAVRERLRSEGWTIHSTQEEVEIPVIPGVIIRGHTDGVISKFGETVSDRALLEVKSMSTKQFDKWMRKKWGEFEKYAWQITAYMAGYPGLDCYYVVKRREDGLMDRTVIPASQPPADWKAIKKKVVTAERWRRKKELPPCDVKNQWGCPFFYLHEEDNFEEIEIPDDEARAVLEQLVAEFVSLKEKERIGMEAADVRKKEISPEIFGLVPGDYIHIEVAGTLYKITKSGQTKSWVDLAAMREDGHGDLLDRYAKTTRIAYPLVREVKKKEF